MTLPVPIDLKILSERSHPRDLILWAKTGFCFFWDDLPHTVDGSEIRRSPVDMVVYPIIYDGFPECWVVSRISEPSTVPSMGRLYIYLHEWLFFLMVNVGKYFTIHGWYGMTSGFR